MSVRFHLLLLFTSAIVPTVSGKVYTLDRLIEEALRNSVALRSVNKELEQAESGIQELYAGLFPRVSASVDFGHTFAYYLPFMLVSSRGSEETGGGGSTIFPLSQNRTDGPTGSSGLLARSESPMQAAEPLENLITIPRNTAAASLSLQQPVFLQGKTISNFKIARARQRILLCKYEETRDRIKCETTKLYFRILLEQKRIEISKEHLRLAEEAHRLSTVNYSLGHARQLDTLNSLLQLEQARIDVRKAESGKRTAGESIITECGLTVASADFWVEGEYPEPVFYITADEAVVQLHQGNRRIIQFRGNEIIQNELVNLAKAEYLPVISCGATLGRIGRFSRLDRLDDLSWGDDQKLFIRMSWTLFSGLARQHIVRQRIDDREIVLFGQQRAVDSLELVTRSLFERIMMEQDQLSAMQAIVTIAGKGHQLAKVAYKVGSGTLFDLQNARLELGRKNLAFNEALCSFHCSVTDFKFLIGMLR